MIKNYFLFGMLFISITLFTSNMASAQTTVTFQDGIDSYSGTRDTYLYDSSPATVRGAEDTFVQDINSSNDRTSLLLFDVSSIPTGSTITSAELQFYVDGEGQGFDMHRMLTVWDEATISFSTNSGHFANDDTDAEISIDATWPGDNGYTGYITITVPASTIQDWIDGNLTNNGWLMLALDGDGQQLRSREYATVENRPELTVIYASTNPIISISGTPLSNFVSRPEVISAEQSYTVSGSNLTADIEITAPADFEISTSSGSGFGSSVTLSQSGGTVASTTIYVHFGLDSGGTSSGDITHTSTDATQQDVAVNGRAVYTFQEGVDSYAGTLDTYISNNNTGAETTDYSTAETMIQDNDSNGTINRTSLLFFDLSAIPTGSTVSKAELQFYVNTEGMGFSMHLMLTSWVETATYTSIGGAHFDADDVDATNTADATWADGTSVDENGDVIATVDGYTGYMTLTIPAATIENWINSPSTNFGWLMISTDAGGDGQQLRTSEHATIDHRPKLILEHTDVSIVLSAETLTFKNGLSVYPNPSRDVLFINANQSNERIETITIFDVAGRAVKVIDNPVFTGNQIQVDTSSMRNALYFMSVTSESGNKATFKIVIEK